MKLIQDAKLDECVLGIEPNEHQIPRFLGKYSYHTHLTENPISSSSQIYRGVDW